ncbi:mandelate racemase/muconate lactonizing enzyme family protein [Candidatus Poribacteria bacterium]|nr:mandelate racemase/muconate lactonizing enzyme family protein [Candidatus Poribacteria bacterium]
MKITKVETLCLSRPHEPNEQWRTAKYLCVKADCAIVRIHTDEGVTGVGEASAYGDPPSIRSWVDHLAPELVGKDPRDPRVVPHPNGRSHAYDTAVAGIDIALWDIRGKLEGKRIAQMLTVKPLDRVRLYASGGCRYDWRDRPEQLIEEALGYIAEGYTAMKFRIGTDWSWSGVTVDRFLGLVRELAQAVGNRMELMLDGNCRLDEDQAMAIARELDRLGFAWFEEPIPWSNIDGYATLCAAVDMPITGGESFTTLEQFRPFFEKRAYDIVQQDAGLCGITETMRIAEAAHRHGIDTCPHSWHNGLMAMANAHCVAALPRPRVLELNRHQGPLQWDILSQRPDIEDGYLVMPGVPGIGVDIADRLEERFPHIAGSYAVALEN